MSESPIGTPMVTIVITYFNEPRYIRESIESALAQTHPSVEVLVVDDGSTEQAHQALLLVPGPRVIRQANGGVADARNRGMREARGEYIVFLDHDDRLLPDSIASHLRAIPAGVKPGLIFAGIREIDSAGQPNGNQYLCAPRRNYFESMLEVNPIHCPAAAMISRDALVELGGLDPALAPSEDYDLYLHLAERLPVIRHRDLVAEYRIHGTNVSNDRSKMVRATGRVLDKAERTLALTADHRRRIALGRKRADLIFTDRKSPGQRLQMLRFRLRSLLQSSLLEMWRERR